MEKNVGSVDRVLRFAAAVVLFSLFFLLEGQIRYLGLLGIVPLVTGLMNFCPLYKIMGLNTCSKCK